MIETRRRSWSDVQGPERYEFGRKPVLGETQRGDILALTFLPPEPLKYGFRYVDMCLDTIN